MSSKVCKHCSPPRELPLTTEYWSVRSRSRDGFASKCKDCERRDHKEYYMRRKKDKRRKEVHRKSNYKLLYNITIEDFNRMFEEQGGACGICVTKDVPLVVDHDHATGEPRGLLCNACNHGLGRFRDSVVVLSSAIRYLENHDAKRNATIVR